MAFGKFGNSARIPRMIIKKPSFKLPLAIITTMLIGAGCASNPDAADPDAEVTAAEIDRRLDSDPNKRQCRTIRPTGSRFGERVCKTNAEWSQVESDSRNAVKRMQQDQSVNTGGGDGK